MACVLSAGDRSANKPEAQDKSLSSGNTVQEHMHAGNHNCVRMVLEGSKAQGLWGQAGVASRSDWEGHAGVVFESFSCDLFCLQWPQHVDCLL